MIEKAPDYVLEELKKRKIRSSDIVLAASGDVLLHGDFGESWAIVTKEDLIILHGSRGSKKGQADGQWFMEDMQIYPLKEVEKMNNDGLPFGGMLTGYVGGEPHVLCRYSNTNSRKFGLFTKLVNNLREGKELTEEDFQDSILERHCPKCGLLYTDPERKICAKCLNKSSLFIRVLSFVPRYKLQVGLIILFMFISAGLNVVSPYLEGKVLFDEVLASGGRYEGRIGSVVALIAAVQLLAILAGVAHGRINAGLTAKVVYDLKCEVFSAMQRLSLGYYNNKQTGGLMTRVNNDSTHLQYFFHDGLPYLIVNIVMLMGILITLFSVNWFLTLLILIPIPIAILLLRNMFPKLHKLFYKRYRATSSMNALLNDTFTGVRVVKAFGKEAAEISRFSGVNGKLRSVEVDVGKMNATMFPLIHLLLGFGGLVVWGVGGWQVAKGQMTFGVLITFTRYLGMLYGPLQFLTQVVDWWSSCMNSAQRIFEIIDSVPEITESPNPISIPHIKGEIRLENVTFSYEPNKPVLKNIHIEIRPGEMVGLVGHSGAGKSTIANLITRLYETEEGTIYIDGIPISQIAIKDLRKQIGMVLQETFLFAGTIGENIAYGTPEASELDIIRAAKAANAHDFIMELPNGYDTMIGKSGLNLSGGQRQRISIARTILHNPRILILDEATASVDTETERQIQEALGRLIQGRTTIAIAHRLSTLRDADKLVVMDKGKVVEMGTHEELVRLEGEYFKMLRQQTEALKIKGVGD